MNGGGGTIFVYGTLMADEVLKLLLKRVPPSKPATLRAHRRHSIKGQVFPAIVPAEGGASVRGKVLLQLTRKELEILDGACAAGGSAGALRSRAAALCSKSQNSHLPPSPSYSRPSTQPQPPSSPNTQCTRQRSTTEPP